ncbi:uncharacterized protein LOC110876367 [Helianthus annuus]|uniref:uncharacterized protein LOC110876367 n=1 Tax=Helianthus annuus TaxID=4232 RepID=UPI000B8F90D7|nr:uncharacterized protein LOC110876367 [Helianthus annuus]
MAKKLMLSNTSESNNWHMSWKGWVPLKCKIMAWRATINRLPTKTELLKRGVPVPNVVCALCNSDEETTLHLYTGCFYATEIWSGIQDWCRLAPIFALEVSDLIKMVDLITTTKQSRYILRGIIITTMWELWNERNNRIFKGKSRRALEVVENIKTTSYFWIRNRSRFKDIDWNVWCNFPLNLM